MRHEIVLRNRSRRIPAPPRPALPFLYVERSALQAAPHVSSSPPPRNATGLINLRGERRAGGKRRVTYRERERERERDGGGAYKSFRVHVASRPLPRINPRNVNRTCRFGAGGGDEIAGGMEKPRAVSTNEKILFSRFQLVETCRRIVIRQRTRCRD